MAAATWPRVFRAGRSMISAPSRSSSLPKKPAEAGSPRSTPIALSGRERPNTYCACSMSRSSAPASKARANPSPVFDLMFEVKGA
jgi:hypothetical protein